MRKSVSLDECVFVVWYLVVVVEPHVGAGGALPGVGQVLVDLPAGRHAGRVHDAVAHRALAQRRRPVATCNHTQNIISVCFGL